MSSLPDRENHRRTVFFSHLCEPLPYRYATREVQRVPNQGQTLGSRWIRELGLAGGMPGLEILREYDEGNSSSDGDSQRGDCLRIVEHGEGNWVEERMGRIYSAMFIFMRCHK